MSKAPNNVATVLIFLFFFSDLVWCFVNYSKGLKHFLACFKLFFQQLPSYLNREVKKLEFVECPKCGGQLHVADDEPEGVCSTCGRTMPAPKPKWQKYTGRKSEPKAPEDDPEKG